MLKVSSGIARLLKFSVDACFTLIRKIVFEDDEDQGIVQRAWEGLIPNLSGSATKVGKSNTNANRASLGERLYALINKDSRNEDTSDSEHKQTLPDKHVGKEMSSSMPLDDDRKQRLPLNDGLGFIYFSNVGVFLSKVPGLVNVDFANVRAIMENAGSSLMGIGTTTGKLSGSLFADFFLFTKCFIDLKKGAKEARDAALNAIQSPLLDVGIERATRIVWNITGGSDLTLYEDDAVKNLVTKLHCKS
ncbi:uncharacterized protein LOC114280702 [Camellia sinensis]|uniref:uncharacterized protein LOC114280702 n=1 Tax=Camellia sinensis TaxID=4442 RepID=UPI0010362478|nr:uncharacterized protein LOC114280702 [Camellia sinensis]